jgi:hypothetical protein
LRSDSPGEPSLLISLRSGRALAFGTFATVFDFEHIPKMGEKFHGSLDDLKAKIGLSGLMGEWAALANGVHKYGNAARFIDPEELRHFTKGIRRASF